MCDDDNTPDLCATCNGSGEGMYDGSTCSVCKGSGVEPARSYNVDDEPPYYDEYAEQPDDDSLWTL